MSVVLSVELMDREAGELPTPVDRIVAVTLDNPDPLMKYRIMDGRFFRISSDARYWFALSAVDATIGSPLIQGV